MDPNQHNPEPSEGDDEGGVQSTGDEGMNVSEAVVVTTTNPEENKNEFTSATDPMLSQGIVVAEEFRNKENELPPEKMTSQQQIQQQPQHIIVTTPIAGLAVTATGPGQHALHAGGAGGATELHYGGGGGQGGGGVSQQLQQQHHHQQMSAANSAMQNVPTRQYLDQAIVPILLQGLSALAKERPSDPIQYLAEYLVRHKDKYGIVGSNPALGSLNGQ